MRLYILLVLAILSVSVNGGSVHTFDHFTVRNKADQSCFVYEAGTTADATQLDLGKCVIGCGGSIMVEQAKRNQEYIFSQYNSTDCSGSAGTQAGFKCPNPSIDPVKVSNTDYTIKCGTNPKSKSNDNNADDIIDDTVTTKSKGGNNSKPKAHDSNEIAGFSEETEDNSSSKSKSKPKSPKTAQDSTAATAEDDTDNETKSKGEGNSATSTIASLSLVLVSLIAALSL